MAVEVEGEQRAFLDVGQDPGERPLSQEAGESIDQGIGRIQGRAA